MPCSNLECSCSQFCHSCWKFSDNSQHSIDPVINQFYPICLLVKNIVSCFFIGKPPYIAYYSLKIKCVCIYVYIDQPMCHHFLVVNPPRFISFAEKSRWLNHQVSSFMVGLTMCNPPPSISMAFPVSPLPFRRRDQGASISSPRNCSTASSALANLSTKGQKSRPPNLGGFPTQQIYRY